MKSSCHYKVVHASSRQLFIGYMHIVARYGTQKFFDTRIYAYRIRRIGPIRVSRLKKSGLSNPENPQ